MKTPESPSPALEQRVRRPLLLSRSVSFILGGSRIWALGFLAAVITSVVGGVAWLVNHFKSSPQDPAVSKYLPLAVSFAGAFLIGRLVRQFAKTAAVITGLVVLAIGWAAHLTADPDAGNALKQEATLVKDRVTHAKDYFLSLLPSATGAAIGVFAGSRKSTPREVETS